MGSISEQDYQDILKESVGAWFRTDEDDEDEMNGFICKEINNSPELNFVTLLIYFDPKLIMFG